MQHHSIQDSNPAMTSLSSGVAHGGVSVLDIYKKLLNEYADLEAYWFMEARMYRNGSHQFKVCEAKAQKYDLKWKKVWNKIMSLKGWKTYV